MVVILHCTIQVRLSCIELTQHVTNSDLRQKTVKKVNLDGCDDGS